ncbi:hypothetical protein [Streptosporangium sp. NPDC049644]|uniref:hypothetical protein n=1 Tax=Streptosporangium sp. NPDC049644 TaxID=3155507 RepID=UPI00343CC927
MPIHIALRVVELDFPLELRQAGLGLRGGRAGEPVVVMVDDQVPESLTAGESLLGFDFVAEAGVGRVDLALGGPQVKVAEHRRGGSGNANGTDIRGSQE